MIARDVDGRSLVVEVEEVEATMKMLNSIAIAVSSVLLIVAGGSRADTSEAPAERGVVEVTGRTVKAVTIGPATVHAYSGFAGGAIFVARASAGTDADCAAALASPAAAHPTTLVADVVVRVQLGVGEVACLVTDTSGAFELLWHAFASGESP
jgi:hypothetical protein